MACLFLMAFPSQVLATSPPILPPDPVALEAARQLVEQLPISETPLDFLVGRSIEQANSKDAVAQLDFMDPDLLEDEDIERIFIAETELESRRLLPACIPQAKEVLAEFFARNMAAEDARSIASFLATKPGRALGRTIAVGPFLEALKACTYRALSPNLEGILRSAVETNHLRRRVNSEASGDP